MRRVTREKHVPLLGGYLPACDFGLNPVAMFFPSIVQGPPCSTEWSILG